LRCRVANTQPEPTNGQIGLQKPLSRPQFNGEESWTLPVPARYVIGDSAQPLRNPEAAHNRLHRIEGQRGNVEIRKQKRSEREKEAANQPSTEHFQDGWIFHHDGVPLSGLQVLGIMQPVRSRSIAVTTS
jgi:hypothetical protein